MANQPPPLTYPPRNKAFGKMLPNKTLNLYIFTTATGLGGRSKWYYILIGVALGNSKTEGISSISPSNHLKQPKQSRFFSTSKKSPGHSPEAQCLPLSFDSGVDVPREETDHWLSFPQHRFPSKRWEKTTNTSWATKKNSLTFHWILVSQ